MNQENTQNQTTWDETSYANFQKILEQIPPMIRGVAEARVFKKAERIIQKENRNVITEKDMVDAFFDQTPEGFVPDMKKSMDELKIDYRGYGYN